MKPRHYDWSTISVDDCLVFRVHDLAELACLRHSVYTYGARYGRNLSCLQVPGIVFVVREPDGRGTVGSQLQETATCPDDPSETKCKAWRLYVPTVRRSERRPRLTLRTAPAWDQRQPRRNTPPLSKPVYTVSRSGQVQAPQSP